jgi:hypothetical protein
MKYIVCGFYNHHNLGDDMFKIAFKQLLPNDSLDFVEIVSINNDMLKSYDAVIVGGGDLMNDFYGNKFKEVLSKYNGYKIAIGVGFSFEACTTREYINYFDDIMIRNKTDIIPISKYLGTIHTHSIPDIVFSIPLNYKEKVKEGNKIGLYLVGSLIKSHSFMFSLLTFINKLITLGYKLELIPMYTDETIEDNDVKINEYIYKTFSHTSLIKIHGKLSMNEFIEVSSYMDFGICIRFHAHIICTRLSIPFLSIPITRKDEIYVNEMPSDTGYTVNLTRDAKYNVIKFDVEDAMIKFNNIIQNKKIISNKLLDLNNYNHNFFKSNKVSCVVKNKQKRIISPNIYKRLNPEDIYVKYRNLFYSKGINHHTDDALDIISKEELHNIGDELCYEITKDSANEYIYGTRINLETKLHLLRDMIYYIYHDYTSKLIYPKINIDYIKQDSFRGLHRAGWQYAIDSLYCLSNEYGVYIDTYVDRTFGWASNVLQKSGVIPYTNFWIGFIHHTFDTEYSQNNCTELFKNTNFINSLQLCKGLFCLTEYLAELIRKKLTELGYNINVNVLNHPTIFPSNKFTLSKYKKNDNKKLINVGSWYRNPVSIYRLKEHPIIKYSCLKGKRMESNFCPNNILVKINNNKLECDNNIWTKYFIKYINSQCDDFSKNLYNNVISNGIKDLLKEDIVKEFLNKVEIITKLEDNDYDNLLASNIVFLDLVDASVANTIIECIVRNTPIVVNKIPPIIELLGDDYPLFYNNLEEVPDLLTDEQIELTYLYLKKLPKNKYRIENFLESFTNSSIYKSL